MPQGCDGRGSSDLIPGIGAAVAFLILVFVLRMPLLLAAGLAGAVYVGLRLTLQQTRETAAPAPTEWELLQSISQHQHAVTDLSVRRKITGICEQARLFLQFLTQHPQQAQSWQPIVRECLVSTLRVTAQYVHLVQFLDDPSHPSLREAEELLDQVSSTFATLRRRLVDERAADLSAEMELFRSTLQAVNEVNLVNRGGSS